MVADGRAISRSALEVERKYDVGPDVPVPALDRVAGVHATTDPHEQQLEAVYFDTADLRLRAAGITLRHRTGGSDDGWHLKLPAGQDREEIGVDGDGDHVPEALAALVRAHVRRRELSPVASLTTRRVVRRLLADDGEPLAELADDTVTGRTLPTGTPLLWREWEVELLSGGRDLLEALHDPLTLAGALRASSTSKLGRVLAAPPPSAGAPPWWVGKGKGQQDSAGTAVLAHLSEQVAELIARDPQVRRDVPDTLHKMRVATRRLRSALATFRPLLDRAQSDPVRDELKWLAAVLGEARDAEVMHARLLRLITAEPDDLVLGRVLERVDQEMTQRHRAAHDRVLVELDADRYLRLLDRLDELVAAPPFLEAAGGDADEVLPDLVRRTWRRLHRTMKAAERAEGPEQEELLHDVRKLAKQTRYAAEAVQPVFGRPARRYAEAIAQLQESLGDFQDGVVTRQVLRELGDRGHRSGENSFTLGRLHALEQVRAERAVQQFPKARAEASKAGLRRWFRG